MPAPHKKVCSCLGVAAAEASLFADQPDVEAWALGRFLEAGETEKQLKGFVVPSVLSACCSAAP